MKHYKNETLWDILLLEIEYRWGQVRSFFYNIKHFFYNCWSYAPILWSDRDWDQVFIYKLLKHKLVKQRECIVKHGHSVSKVSDHQDRTLTICINLLDRLIKEEYAHYLYDKHDAKWGKMHILEMKETGDNRAYRGLFQRDKVVTEKQKEQESKEFMRISEHEEYMIRQDLAYLTMMIRKHIRTWWD